MKPEKNSTVKSSETEKVTIYIESLKHPLAPVAAALRQVILGTSKDIGEEIKWNAPAFFYTGPMKAFDPKEYKRHIIVFNFSKKDCIRLVLPSGAKVNDKSGLLEGDYTDGRRLALFHDLASVKAKESDLKKIIRDWLKLVDK